MTGQLYDLLSEVKCENTKELISRFLQSLFMVYRDLYFTYMEINPLVIKNGKVYILDLAAKIDQVRVNNRCYKYKRNYSRPLKLYFWKTHPKAEFRILSMPHRPNMDEFSRNRSASWPEKPKFRKILWMSFPGFGSKGYV